MKYTKTNKVMAFLTVEDLVGTVEVMVFPRDYEKWQNMINEDAGYSSRDVYPQRMTRPAS